MRHINLILILQLLTLLALANGAPLIAKKILGTAFAYPLDNGVTLADGQPLLGRSKTIRGIVLSIAVTTLAAPWVGISPAAGLLISAVAMIGDLFSSFIKRRMKLPPAHGARARSDPRIFFPRHCRTFDLAGLGSRRRNRKRIFF